MGFQGVTEARCQGRHGGSRSGWVSFRGEVSVMKSICPLTVLDARLDHKLKSLSKYHKICESLRQDIKSIENHKDYILFQMMGGKGVY